MRYLLLVTITSDEEIAEKIMTKKQKIGSVVLVAFFVIAWAMASGYDYWYLINK